MTYHGWNRLHSVLEQNQFTKQNTRILDSVNHDPCSNQSNALLGNSTTTPKVKEAHLAHRRDMFHKGFDLPFGMIFFALIAMLASLVSFTVQTFSSFACFYKHLFVEIPSWRTFIAIRAWKKEYYLQLMYMQRMTILVIFYNQWRPFLILILFSSIRLSTIRDNLLITSNCFR